MFVVANSALLLTHYYNAFFWAAQGLVACVFVLSAMRPRNWLKGIGCVTVLYGMQAAIFVGVWGRNLLREIGERSGPLRGSRVRERAAEPIFHPVGQCCITQHQNARDRRVGRSGAGRCGWSGCRFRCSETYHLDQERIEAWTTIYLLSWMVLPVVILYLAFLVAGVALYPTDTSSQASLLLPHSSC